MRFLFLPLLLISAFVSAQSYKRSEISQWMQEGDWDRILLVSQGMERPDSFLLQFAGYAAYQSGDRALAADYYGRLLSIDSTNKLALYYTGIMLKADDQYGAAIPLLRRLCVLAPNVSQYQVLLADCYTAKEERTAAVRHLKVAQSLSPKSPVIGNKLANAWMRLKMWDSANVVLSGALAARPQDPGLLTTGIALAYTTRQYARASALADSLIMTGKPRYDAILTALYADIRIERYAHATQLGNLLMEFGSKTEDVLYYTAYAHQHLKQWVAADTLLRKCISSIVKPNLEVYYLAEAEGAEQLKDYVRSKGCYDTAYYLFKNPQTLYRKGLMLRQAGKAAEAEQAFRKYLALPDAKQDTAIAHYLEQVIRD